MAAAATSKAAVGRAAADNKAAIEKAAADKAAPAGASHWSREVGAMCGLTILPLALDEQRLRHVYFRRSVDEIHSITLIEVPWRNLR